MCDILTSRRCTLAHTLMLSTPSIHNTHTHTHTHIRTPKYVRLPRGHCNISDQFFELRKFTYNILIAPNLYFPTWMHVPPSLGPCYDCNMCMCMCMCVCVYYYMASSLSQIFASQPGCMSLRLWALATTAICVCVCMYAWSWLCVCMFACMNVCVCMYE
jgi:hypothetical protein